MPNIEPQPRAQDFHPRLALLDGRTLQWLLCLGIMLLGLLNALPHLHEAIWQDEAATLEFSASHGVLHPFAHYGTPNNHIAFSAMLAGWRGLVANPLDPASLRLLPLGLFMLAIAATFLAARRVGGPVCALIAATLFATSPVAGNFATQLRGYGPSWLFVALALLCALQVLAVRGKWGWRVGYALATLVSVWILPTNLFLVTVVGGSVAVFVLLERANRNAEGLRASAILLFAPLAGFLLAYAAVWGVLVFATGVIGSPWTPPGLLGNWWHGTLSDFRWFVPFAGAGLLLGAIQWLRRDTSETEPGGSREWVLAVVLLAGFAIAVIAMPHTPFPRTLVPYLPAWYCALALLATGWLRMMLRGQRRMLGLALLVACALPLALPAKGPSCRADPGNGAADDYDLCHQYFRDRYHPEKVMAYWTALARPDVPIATNFEGYHALRALGSPAHVFEYRFFPPTAGAVPLIVAHDDAEMQRMATSLGLGNRDYGLVDDTGYFKAYGPRR